MPLGRSTWTGPAFLPRPRRDNGLLSRWQAMVITGPLIAVLRFAGLMTWV
jgi:hypothetical protein